MIAKFLAKYFPPSKATKLRNDITTFSSFKNESNYEAWERYKGLLRKILHLEFSAWLDPILLQRIGFKYQDDD